jgi:two-component system chemotaxis response regulator CheY
MSKRKVLLVDDSTIITKQLQKILDGSEDFKVVGQAKNGREGLELFSSLKPDIVCMDLVMPEFDGLQAIRSIMSLDKAANIVVISSAGGVGDQVMEALNFGAKNVITKPFQPERVLEVLKGV